MKNNLFMTGTILEVVDPELYEIKVDIPGIVTGVSAFPMRGEVDEPKVGDLVLLKCLDPIMNSYFLYQKFKEDDFIGFRSRGKMVDITPDSITIGIFDPSAEFSRENPRPEITDWIRLGSDGVLEIHTRSDIKTSTDAGAVSEVKSNMEINIKGNVNIKVLGSTTIQSSKIDIKGPGTLTCKGVVTPSATGGPFIAVPTAPPPGTPMISGDTIILS